MQVAICVCDYDIELFAVGEEICGHYFDAVGRFAEEAELVGVLLVADEFLVD